MVSQKTNLSAEVVIICKIVRPPGQTMPMLKYSQWKSKKLYGNKSILNVYYVKDILACKIPEQKLLLTNKKSLFQRANVS